MRTRPNLTRTVIQTAVAALFAAAASAGVAGNPVRGNAYSDQTGGAFDDEKQAVRARGPSSAQGRRLDEDQGVRRKSADSIRQGRALDQDDPAMVQPPARAEKPARTARERD